MESCRGRIFTEGIKEIFRPRSSSHSKIKKCSKEMGLGINGSGKKDSSDGINKSTIVLQSNSLPKEPLDRNDRGLASSTDKKIQINDRGVNCTVIKYGNSVTDETTIFNNCASKNAYREDKIPFGGGLFSENEGTNARCQICPLDIDPKKNGLEMNFGLNSERNGKNLRDDNRCHVGERTESLSLENVVDVNHFNKVDPTMYTNNNNSNYIRRTKSENIIDTSEYKSVLSCILEDEKNDRNDIIILSLGIHQYLEEIFKALDVNNNGYVDRTDLNILCKVLGKEIPGCEIENEPACQNGAPETCSNQDCNNHLNFDKFSSLLKKIFSSKFTSNLTNRNNEKLVNAVVNITRRNETLNAITKLLENIENNNMNNSFTKSETWSSKQGRMNDRNECFKCKQETALDKNDNIEFYKSKQCIENLELHKIILLQYQELQCLREVIEDLRIALQSSDAENLSLKVRDEKLKTDYKSILSLTEDNSFKEISLTDEEESLDRMIINLPSKGRMKINSRENSYEKIVTKSHTDSINQLHDEGKLKDEQTSPRTIHDDISLEKELQATYQTISEVKHELEATRVDLENTVTEMQDKNRKIDHLKLLLLQSKENFENSAKENCFLRDKLRQISRERDSKNIFLEMRDKELTKLKTELKMTEENLKTVERDYKTIKKLRKQDLEKLVASRKMVEKSMSETLKTEASLRALLRNQSLYKTNPLDTVVDVQENKDDTISACNKNRQSTQDNPSPTCHLQRFWETDNTGMKGEEMQLIRPNSSSSSPFASRGRHSKSSQLTDHLNSGKLNATVSNNWMADTPSLLSPQSPLISTRTPLKVGNASTIPTYQEIKPTMEVKPNVIKPLTTTRTEICTSKKPFQHTNSLSGNALSELSAIKRKYNTQPLGYPLIDEKHSDGTLDDLQHPTLKCNSFKMGGEPSWSFGKDFPEEGKELIIKPSSKCPSQTSTQILEGLEAEVELLMKSLEDDQSWG